MQRLTLFVFVLSVACGGSSSNQYVATLAAANEVPANASTATGTATFTVNGSTVSYTITYTGLSGPPGASHIHAGAAGVSGPVVVPFSGLSTTATGSWNGTFTGADVKAGTSGSTTVRDLNLDDVINAMKSGDAYVNVHTGANPGGEIRGQIQPK